MRDWLCNMTHPSQYPIRQGAQKAVAKMNRVAESVLSRSMNVWAVSIAMT